MQKFLKRLFSRVVVVGVAILAQILWIIGFTYLLGSKYQWFAAFIQLLCIVAVLGIANKRINPSYKLAWTILILAMPLVGMTIYLMFGKSRLAKAVEDSFEKAVEISAPIMQEQTAYRGELEKADFQMNKQSVYLRDYAGCPVYQNTATEYFPVGELLYQRMIEELKKAEHFIFLEYFIIDDGEMWKTILDILEEKARIGLDVRLIYDDMGCVNTLPSRFYEEIRARGIQCEVFNRFLPVASVVLNNRDHRKIMVIDGHTGFTGGINLADEYINRKVRFGHWKDTGVMLKGEAVWSFTVMFLQMWSVIRRDTRELQNISQYQTHSYYKGNFENDGFVQPYNDTPLDHETVGENAYLNMINQAKKYVYIFTPYLIIDNEMMTALCLAAKNGVDVRIVTPGIPDKKMVFMLTRSYYEQLIDAGVKVYEYEPGFLHAKSFVCDDEAAIVGTINLDYRSLYLHFECGVWMYRSRAVMQVKEDVLDTLEHSREITKEFCRSWNTGIRLTQSVLRLLAPML